MYWPYHRTSVPFYRAQPTYRIDVESLIKNDALWSPESDLVETAEAFELTLDAPGVLPEGVELWVTDERFLLRITPTVAAPPQFELRTRERNTATRTLQSRFSTAIDIDGVAAVLETGVLRVSFPKLVKRGPTRIEVRIQQGNDEAQSMSGESSSVSGESSSVSGEECVGEVGTSRK